MTNNDDTKSEELMGVTLADIADRWLGLKGCKTLRSPRPPQPSAALAHSLDVAHLVGRDAVLDRPAGERMPEVVELDQGGRVEAPRRRGSEDMSDDKKRPSEQEMDLGPARAACADLVARWPQEERVHPLAPLSAALILLAEAMEDAERMRGLVAADGNTAYVHGLLERELAEALGITIVIILDAVHTTRWSSWTALLVRARRQRALLNECAEVMHEDNDLDGYRDRIRAIVAKPTRGRGGR